MSECLVTYRDNGKSINATAPVSFSNRVEQFIQPPHDIHDFPIDLDLNDSIDLSEYAERLNKIDLFSSVILTNNYTEITSTITILIFNGHEHENNRNLSLLLEHVKDAVNLTIRNDHQQITITNCLAAYNGSKKSWDKGLNDLIDQIAESVSSVFNEDVLSEEIINLIRL